MTATAIRGEPRAAQFGPEAVRVRGHGARPPARTGALLAVCAVAPGAGASTLSQLIALAAADRGTGKIMLCHAAAAPEPPTPTTAAAVRRDLLGFVLRPAPARAPHVVAVPAGASAARVGRKLARARSAYALTIVDCGTLRRPAERIALDHATHLAWVLAATEDGLTEAERAIRRARRPDTELLIARRDPAAEAASPIALRQLADGCAATLILAPWLSARDRRREASALAGAQIAVQAILGVLARRPVRT